MPEAWLRGAVEGVPRELMPAAHSLIDAVEDIERAVEGLEPSDLWATPGGVASIGFHLQHVPGSLERLLTYARGESLSPSQLRGIPREREPGDPPASLGALLARLRAALDTTLDAYRSADTRTLLEMRHVGRAGLESDVQGVLFHAAEHARRHAGQVIATAGILRSLDRSTSTLGPPVDL